MTRLGDLDLTEVLDAVGQGLIPGDEIYDLGHDWFADRLERQGVVTLKDLELAAHARKDVDFNPDIDPNDRDFLQGVSDAAVEAAIHDRVPVTVN